MNTTTTFAARTGTTSRGKTMKRLFATMLTATCALAPLALAPTAPARAQSVIRPASDIVLSVGRGELITVPGAMTDIFVANEAIADVQVKSQRQLYVFGKSGGTTTVYASNAAGDVIWSANVRVGSNIDSVDQMLALAMPDARISVATMGTNTVLLTGTIASPEDAAEAERLVEAFVGEDANVVSRLRMATPLQVNLQVRFAEVSRSLVRTLGANLASIDGTDGFQFGIGQGRGPTTFRPGSATGVGSSIKTQIPDPNNPGKFIEVDGTNIPPASLGTTIAGVGEFLGLDLAGALDLAERQGLVTTLSQPNLTALSGETASFLAGGEFPIPISQGLGSTSIEYRKFGVSLSYTPYVLANGRISIRVRPEVSELSSQGAVTLNGFQVPALTIRRAETTVELGSGQSFMIAGLMSNSSQSSIEKAPGLGDLPILGNLFRSTEFRRGETELVIVVTPYLVNPVNDRDIILPTDGFRSPNVAQQLLLNQNQDGQSGARRPGPTEAIVEQAPQVGAAQQGNTAPARTAALPTPGFSLND
ncbi:type II and III secretion system protein family protein [Alteriqipengyuania sp. WL0013]|uniref:type II and III secretion system protein family protein n=1 Tax=Alteriqipengyuania sp. WL0013 TaxID=3110773 RepID=UPI002C4F2AFD|nr:type II and III secretion system protein family protein [Alteriqipengyuania sp. WL0013]MEB3415849.1 type II and III secretion system protein family protein [Alteriqipengyuania sp. WL0013]